MKRVVIDHFGGPEVVSVIEDDDPQPGPGEVRVNVLASGVSLSDAQMRAGTYLGGPKPPFTPGYELVGVVDQLGPGCTRLREGDRVGVLTQWGANAERVCVPEKYAVGVPEDLDPAEVVSLVFTYMTAYQMLHRSAKAKPGETLLVHGAAGRVGTAVLELAAVAGLRTCGTASAHDREAVERLGAVAIDYRNEDFLAKVRELTATVWTSCLTRSVARWGCAPSARCGRAEGLSSTAGKTRFRHRAARIGQAYSSGTWEPPPLACGACCRRADAYLPTGSRNCASITRIGSERTSPSCSSCFGAVTSIR
jgi:NADPH:quinone reductase-like Zn-dependent oxidoreductase